MAVQHNKPPIHPTARPQTARTQTGTFSEIVKHPHDSGAYQEMIRVRAYKLWEQAGRPDSDGTQFWLQAEQELESNK